MKAKVEAAVNAAIKGKVDNEPKISAALTAEITNAIQSNAFTLANYSVHNINYDILEKIRKNKLCWNLLSQQNNYLITSVALISSSGKFSESQQKDIQTRIDAELKDAKLNGNTIDGQVSAKLALTVVMNTERDISTVTSNVNSAYSFGLWNPSLDIKHIKTPIESPVELNLIQRTLKRGEVLELKNIYLQP